MFSYGSVPNQCDATKLVIENSTTSETYQICPVVNYRCNTPYTQPILKLNDNSVPVTQANQVLRVGCYNFDYQQEWRYLDLEGQPQKIIAVSCKLS